MTGDPLVGKTVGGRYEILAVIGRGGLGVVYKARQVHLNRLCALKVLSEAVSATPDGLRRFEREAKVACSLENDNIVSIYDFGIDDSGVAYLVMELVDGDDLETVLQRQGRLPAERAIPIFLCITNALSFAHSKSIVHRDLKPSNVIIMKDENGQEIVKLLDFGLAKPFTDSESDSNLTAQSRAVSWQIGGWPY
ncbi:MAG: serine/threonine protein kinase [Cyanobacteria bacterium]|nr:serine/threonine protein kinase [Cyanobacteriota bacterium]